ncbi:MAG: TetR/AcrR family transcriptional regulator [Candidatus Marinimicrobia bacterium CG08_land_8_20_14_0_20_45_22]|nr:MAG: TetR/AcrR family transcriptional regulator [Candidatus Marinimicrobia bacterium CG08_land_8_20_14_0_20_45_22]
MSGNEKNTEQLILDAARNVFIEKGFDGARMQEIADTAGINKALLHYYYRSKDQLFESVFRESLSTFFPRIFEVMSFPIELSEKIKLFIDSYIDIILQNPHIPAFILHELNRNPARITDILPFTEKTMSGLLSSLSQEIKTAGFIEISPEQLVTNMISLCIFPFIARPIIQPIFLGNDADRFDEFIQNRKTEVTQFILNALTKK